MSRRLNILLIVLSIGLLHGCWGSETTQITPSKTPPPPDKLTGINFFLETSASMKGYMDGDTEFKNTVNNFLEELHHTCKPPETDSGLQIYLITDTPRRYDSSPIQFIRDLAANRIKFGKSSLIHDIFIEIEKLTDPNELSVLVTDCILSYPHDEIVSSQNRAINRTNMKSFLKPQVTAAIRGIKSKGFCTAVFKQSSKFHGDYYSYQDHIRKLDGDLRPYYIWVVGNRRNLESFIDKLEKEKWFKPEHQLLFGFNSREYLHYHLFYGAGKSGEWMSHKNNLEEVEITENEPVEFLIGLDLTFLPNSIQNTVYLKRNIKIKTTRAVEAACVDISDRFNYEGKEKESAYKYSHFIKTEITTMSTDTATITIYLPYIADPWYQELNIMDDSKTADITGKTFGIKHFIDGVNNAYYAANSKFFKVKVTLKKDN